MKRTSDEVSNLILIFLLAILFILCGVPWIFLMFWISKYFAILVILVWIIGYLVVRGASRKRNEPED